MLILVVAAAAIWFVTGAVVGLLQARRGHWRHEWAPFALLGPLALVIAWYQRQLPPSKPLPVIEAGIQPGTVSVLAGIDGSPEALAAAETVVGLFGPQLRRAVLAAVVDREAAPSDSVVFHTGPWREEKVAREHLEAAHSRLQASCGVDAGTVVLAGDPARALEGFAADNGLHVIVVGRQGSGVSELVLGSCARRLASTRSVPVLVAAGGVATTSAPLTWGVPAEAPVDPRLPMSTVERPNGPSLATPRN